MKNYMWIHYLLVTVLMWAGSSRAAEIIVQITDQRNQQGHLLISLFNNEEGFPGEYRKALRYKMIEITDSVSAVRFDSLAPGSYALSVLHDENDDKKLNTNFLGIPREGTAASNNVRSRFGPPSFDKARFRVDADTVIQRLRLNYF